MGSLELVGAALAAQRTVFQAERKVMQGENAELREDMALVKHDRRQLKAEVATLRDAMDIVRHERDNALVVNGELRALLQKGDDA